MAELLEKILTLPENERWDLAQAILDSLKPPNEIILKQAYHTEKTLNEWKKSGHDGFSLDDLTLMIEKKRQERYRESS